MSPALTGGFFTAEPPGKPHVRSGRREKSKKDLVQLQQERERGRELFTRGRKRTRRDSGCSAGGKEKLTLDPGDRQTVKVFLGSSLSSLYHHLPQICCILSYSLPPPLSLPVLSCLHQVLRWALPWSPLRLLHHPSVPFPHSTTKVKFMVALGAQVVVLQMKSGERKMA